jgi:xanthomonalisin
MKTLAALLALAGLTFSTVPAYAAIQNGRSLSPADRGIGAYRTMMRGLRDLGPIKPATPVHIGVMLRYRNEAELESLVLAQSTKGSRYYHHFMTKEQFANYFAADAATYARTIATLQKHGFRIEQTFANRGMIKATAPAATASRYFGTSFRSVYQTGRGVRYINTSVVRMPSDLRSDVVALSGLHSTVNVSFPIEHGDIRLLRSRAQAELAARGRIALDATKTIAARVGSRSPYAATTPAPGPEPTIPAGSPLTEEVTYMGYGPDVFQASYDYPVYHGYGGANRAVGSVIDSDFSDSDAKTEFTTFKIPRTKTGIRVCTDSNPDACCSKGSVAAGTCVYTPDTEGESTLDAEAIMTLAPQADFYEYLAAQFDDIGIEGAYNRVVSDDKVLSVNSSFGGCESDDPSFEYATNYTAMQGAALGITFSASTGDTGSTSCGYEIMNGAPATAVGISIPAGGSYFTGVGGTDFEVIVNGFYTTETAWTFGGGGVSVFEGVPSYQTGVTNVHTSGRNIPDLAFTADPDPRGNGFVITFGGSISPTGGTSLSSPMWCAMLADMSDEDGLKGGFGLANTGIYGALQDASYASYFHDVILGTNGAVNLGQIVSSPGVPVYAAGVGYDNTTGAGTPLGFELGAYLK